jgi:hypothetical protein
MKHWSITTNTVATILTWTRKHTYASTSARKYERTQARTHASTNARKCERMHARTNTHMHAYTHA